MRLWMLPLMLFSLILAGCAAQISAPLFQFDPDPAPYPDLGLAPELTNETWLNTDAPLRLADLRGKVVLIDMWTFS